MLDAKLLKPGPLIIGTFKKRAPGHKNLDFWQRGLDHPYSMEIFVIIIIIILFTLQNPSIVPQLVELLSSSFSNAECAASILSKCCQVG